MVKWCIAVDRTFVLHSKLSLYHYRHNYGLIRFNEIHEPLIFNKCSCTRTDTLKMLSRLHTLDVLIRCDLCSCSCLDTQIHTHDKFQQRMWRIGAHHGESYARLTLIWMCVYLCFSSSSTNSHHGDDHIFSCLFVCFFSSVLLFNFSLIYSRWESLLELWLDWIGLDLDFVFLIQFEFSIFFLVSFDCFACSQNSLLRVRAHT